MGYIHKSLILILNILIILFEVSCNVNLESTVNCDSDYLDSLKLTKYSEFEIGVDSTMSVYPKSIQIVTNRSRTKRLVVFDDITDKISFFDLNKKNLIKRIKILREGPKGIGVAKITGVQVIQEDSILVAAGQKIYLINSKGESFDQIDFVRNNYEVSGMPIISSEQPAHFDGKFLFVSIYPDKSSFELKNFTSSIMNTFAKINWKSKEIKLFVPYPDPYKKGIYGPNFLFNYQVFNKSTGQFIFSFPAYSNLMIYNNFFSTDPKLVSAINKEFCVITPMSNIEQNYDSYTRFFVKSPSYGGIYFDEKNKLYYRLSFAGRSQDEYNEGKFWKACTISIFNSQFKKIGESLLNEKNNSSTINIDEGLIYCTSETNDENRIKINVFKVRISDF